eukprot:Trichotokara_eunicae@DN5039_c0_g1_i2.p1
MRGRARGRFGEELRDYVDGITRHCHMQKCMDRYSQNEILICEKCERGFHAKCCLPFVKFDVAVVYPWRCPDDKACYKCGGDSAVTSMAQCDACDGYCHVWCAAPSLDSVPDSWACDRCTKCKACTSEIGPEMDPIQLDGRWCSKCVKEVKTIQGTCPVCSKNILMTDAVAGCRTCHRDVHARCAYPKPCPLDTCRACALMSYRSMKEQQGGSMTTPA